MNIETAFLIVVTALLVWLAVYSFYWNFMRPALAAKLRLEISILEGEVLELLMPAARPERRDPLRVVLDRCQRAKRNLYSLSISRVLLTEVAPDIEAEIKRERLVVTGAAPDIARLDDKLSMYLFFVVLINSPLFATIGIGLFGLTSVFDSIRRLLNSVTNKSWEATSTEGDCRRYNRSAHA